MPLISGTIKQSRDFGSGFVAPGAGGGAGGGVTAAPQAWDLARARSLSAPQLGQLDVLAQALQAAQVREMTI